MWHTLLHGSENGNPTSGHPRPAEECSLFVTFHHLAICKLSAECISTCTGFTLFSASYVINNSRLCVVCALSYTQHCSMLFLTSIHVTPTYILHIYKHNLYVLSMHTVLSHFSCERGFDNDDRFCCCLGLLTQMPDLAMYCW